MDFLGFESSQVRLSLAFLSYHCASHLLALQVPEFPGRFQALHRWLLLVSSVC